MADEDPIGKLLRDWRHRRNLSQLDLSIQAGVSARHVSFVETGRTLPSRPMLLHLADALGVPLRERNRLLVAAGYAPTYRARPLDDPDLAAARSALQQVLDGLEPNPTLVLDQGWNLMMANQAASIVFFEGVDLDLFSTITSFDAPFDATLEELAVETYFPATRATAAALGRLVAARPAPV